MAESLKKIEAPILGPQYGANIEQTFKNINDNFGVVGNMDLYKGDAGDGLLITPISLSSLLGSDEEFNVTIGVKTYIIDNQTANITTAIEEMADGVASENINRIIHQLKDSPSSVLATILPTAESQSGILATIVSVHPYVVIDNMFTNQLYLNDPSQYLSNSVDMSCVLCCNTKEEDSDITSNWIAQRAFPYLYFNTETGILNWKINDTDTAIPAQGPAGSGGTNSKTWVVKLGSTVSSNNMYLISKFLDDSDSANPWVNPGSISGDQAPKTGDICIVLPSDASSTTTGYWVSTLYISRDDYKVYCGTDNFRWTALSDTDFKRVMERIGPNQTNEGLVIPCIRSDNNKYYVISVDNNSNLHIGISHSGEQGATQPGYNQNTGEGYNKQIVLDQSVAHSYFNSNGSRDANTASGQGSHAEGYNTTASGNYSHAEGSSTSAEKSGAHAEGSSTEASGNYSHAEGHEAMATGDYSHAEGLLTDAQGKYSHAEGHEAVATGDYSHAEGRETLSFGDYSHAEGLLTNAQGKYSHAEGYYTITTADSEHACGKYNASGDMYVTFARGDNIGVGIIVPSTTTPTALGILPFESSSWNKVGPVVFSIGGGGSASNRFNVFCICSPTPANMNIYNICWVSDGTPYDDGRGHTYNDYPKYTKIKIPTS